MNTEKIEKKSTLMVRIEEQAGWSRKTLFRPL